MPNSGPPHPIDVAVARSTPSPDNRLPKQPQRSRVPLPRPARPPGVATLKTVTVVIGSQPQGCRYQSLLEALAADGELELDLVVCGRRTYPELDRRCCELTARGFSIRQRVELSEPFEALGDGLLTATPRSVAFAEAFHGVAADLVLLLGPAREMLAAAQAARAAKLPVVCLHHEVAAPATGADGEVSPVEATAEAIRGALLELSRHHLVTCDVDRATLIAQGQAAQQVTVCGSPVLDELKGTTLCELDWLATRWGLPTEERYLLVSYLADPVAEVSAAEQVRNLLEAVEATELPVVFARASGMARDESTWGPFRDYAASRADVSLVDRCDWPTYWSLLGAAEAIVGNVPTGLVEAAWLGVPFVNIGSRLRQRPAVLAVLEAGYERDEIFASIATVTAKEFRGLYASDEAPYGDGTSAAQIVDVMRGMLDLPRQAAEVSEAQVVVPSLGGEPVSLSEPSIG
ncbi:MAG: hypothetical protein DWQ31_09925 [Planctomycetota bacterium]|nr:MAG: hypothetical protein DWQ31_09925 [Planctomycetota bacterium]